MRVLSGGGEGSKDAVDQGAGLRRRFQGMREAPKPPLRLVPVHLGRGIYEKAPAVRAPRRAPLSRAPS